MLNGWTDGGFGSFHAAFSQDSQRIIHLRGSLAAGTAGSPAFRLPVGDRPSHNLWLHIYAFDGSAGGLEIQPDGRAFVFDDTGSNSDVSQFASLDGVSFPLG